MARHSPDKLPLIKELCNRLGFSCKTVQLESERGLRSLLPLIQQRLNELQEEDTYGNVEEIPTDSCSVVYAGPVYRKEDVQTWLAENLEEKQRKEACDEKLRRALSTIIRSAVSKQIREILTGQTFFGDGGSISGSCGSSSSSSSGCGIGRRKEDIHMSSVLSEIRSETLFKEVLISAMQAASEEAAASTSASFARVCPKVGAGGVSPNGEASFISASDTDGAVARWSDFRSDFSATSSSAAASGSASGCPRVIPTVTTSSSHALNSSTSGALSALSSSAASSSHRVVRKPEGPEAAVARQRAAFDGFPCYPSPRRLNSTCSRSSRPSTSGEPSSTAASNSALRGFGQATVREGSGGSPVTIACKNETSRWQGRCPQVQESESKLEEPWESGNDEADDEEEGESPDNEDVQTRGMRAAEEEELISYSNRNVKQREKRKRRREFCWAIEDIYQQPYEGVWSVARDNWRFVKDRASRCPPFAQFNRVRREEMVARQTKAVRARKKLLKRSTGEQQDSSILPYSPLELYNGVNHPMGPTAALCRAAFVGGY